MTIADRMSKMKTESFEVRATGDLEKSPIS